MKKSLRNAKLVSAGLLLLCAARGAYAADPVSTMRASAACTADERWSFNSGNQIRYRGPIEGTISGKVPAARAYALAVELGRIGFNAEERALASYWKSRALLQARLPHAAFEGFVALASREPRPDTLGPQAAALMCLNQLRREHPGLPLARAAGDHLPRYFAMARTHDERSAAREMAVGIINDLAASRSRDAGSSVEPLLGVLRGSGASESFALGLWHSSRREHTRTVAVLEPWIKDAKLTQVTPSYLAKQVPHARLLLARAYYSLGRHALAAEQYALVDPRSNEIAEAISERAWSHLLAGKRADAIGASMSLEVGAMRRTFAPEAPMVMSMAFNELCQFPAALRAARLIERNYGASHQWLRQWAKQGGRAPLYNLALQYLKNEGEGAAVPARLAGEWIRGNRFISLQSEISSLYREGEAAADFRAALQGEGDAPAISDWRVRSATLSRELASLRHRLAAEIDRDLATRSKRMLAQLDDVRRNTRLIEVEIFQGASHDMIWRNANADKARDIEPNRLESERASYSRTLKFGGLDTGKATDADANVEVWEDEIGALKADLDDNCSSKTKYLALLKTERR